MLEMIFAQILKMSLTGGCLHCSCEHASSGISQNPAEISVCTVDRGGISPDLSGVGQYTGGISFDGECGADQTDGCDR